MPKATLSIFFASIVAYALGGQQFLWLWPLDSSHHHTWQLLTYAFCHGNLLHLAVNMIVLLSFGPTLERQWGRGEFLTCYAMCAVGGAALQLFMLDKPVMGASGALFGLFAAYTMLHPHRRVVSLIPWPLPAWLVLGLYVALSALAWAFDWLPGVAHLTHVGGVLTGLLVASALKYNKAPVV
jgi:Uncharacterized membrane protein (homolog of Drosophila rhomboid)